MFDKVFDRRGTGSYKWDTIVTDGLIERGAYPLSVADMEFQTPPEVRKAITDFSQKGFFCYTDGTRTIVMRCVNLCFAAIILKLITSG